MDTIITNDKGETLHSEKRTDTIINNNSFTDYTYEENRSFWKVAARQIQTSDFQVGDYHINTTQNINIVSNDERSLPGLFFVENGTVSSRFHRSSRPEQFYSGQNSILYHPFSAEKTVIDKQNDLRLFVVSFFPQTFLQLAEYAGPVLSRLAEGAALNKPTAFNQIGTMYTTARIRQVISEIRCCPYSNGIKQLYIHSKVSELLALQCALLDKEKNARSQFKLSAGDRTRIFMARDIITEQLHDPPSLSALARTIGLNEFKLKNGFRSVFSTSVFNFLRDHRMEIARKAIVTGQDSLTAIAYESGYASLAHFSNAFKKKFGMSPGKMRGSAI